MICHFRVGSGRSGAWPLAGIVHVLLLLTAPVEDSKDEDVICLPSEGFP